MDCQNVKPGLKVRITEDRGTVGMFIHQRHISARRGPGAEGVVLSAAAGHGGDVWFVAHDLDSVGAYCFTEFELIEDLTVEKKRVVEV